MTVVPRLAATSARLVAASQQAAHHGAAHAGPTTVSASSLLFHLVIGLAVVLGLVWVCARLLRGRGAALGRRQAPVIVLGRQSLGKGVSVAVVRAGMDTFLVGVSPQRVSRLARVDGFDTDSGQEITTVELAPTGDADADGDGVLVSLDRHRPAGSAMSGAAAPARSEPGFRALVASLRERTVRRA